MCICILKITQCIYLNLLSITNILAKICTNPFAKYCASCKNSITQVAGCSQKHVTPNFCENLTQKKNLSMAIQLWLQIHICWSNHAKYVVFLINKFIHHWFYYISEQSADKQFIHHYFVYTSRNLSRKTNSLKLIITWRIIMKINALIMTVSRSI
jgi:hypothetical protein